MSKELEVLSRVQCEIIDGFPTGNLWVGMTPEELEQIKSSIQRLESIDNAKPSVALELVGYLKDHHLNAIPYYDWLNDIEKYILKAQEQGELLSYITRFIDDVEISDNGVCYISFKNDTPYLDCIEMDKNHYNKFKKIKESQKGE